MSWATFNGMGTYSKNVHSVIAWVSMCTPFLAVLPTSTNPGGSGAKRGDLPVTTNGHRGVGEQNPGENGSAESREPLGGLAQIIRVPVDVTY